jgi:class 3 adenylate cyclase
VAELPLGTVTFLFTDIEGSTRLWEEHPDAMRDALAAHDLDRARRDPGANAGVVFSEMGDGMAAAFASTSEAVGAVVDAQLGLGSLEWGATGPLRARMGLHAAEGVLRPDGEYVNQPLNRCARADGQSTSELEKIWEVGAKRFARLSHKGSRTVVPEATHYVDIDAPQAAVDAINKVLAQVH